MEAASPQRAEERPRGVGAGLWNLGNTCYVNAALQCLTHTAPLAGDLRVRRHSDTCAKPRSCVLCAMQAHVSRAFLHPADVIEPPKQLFASFHRQQQEDAHEYLMFTLDALQQACVREQGPLAGASPDATLIRQVFGGYWRSQIKCLRCHGVSDTLDPYLDVALDIQGAQSVAQALEALVTPERLDGDNSYECSVCLEKVPACKTLTLHAASKVLILALKRFSPFTGSKKEKVVRYPERLDVQPYLSGQNPGPLLYELYAVLVHAGRDCHNGHYFCYVKAADGQWFKMNDEKVTACAVSTALRQRAYVLFYVQETAVERGHAGPGPQRPVQETSFQDTTLEEWRQLQEPSRPRARYNLRKGEGAPPASSGRIRLPGNRGGRRQHPQGKENCLPDSAGGGKARATRSRRKGMRSLRGIP